MNRRPNSRRNSSPGASFLSFVLLAAMLAFLLFPFYWTFVTSIKPNSELYGQTVTYWPKAPSFDSYRKLFLDYNFLKPMLNSLIVAASTTLISLTVSLLAAYSFSRYRFKGRKLLMTLFLTNNMFQPSFCSSLSMPSCDAWGFFIRQWPLSSPIPPSPFPFRSGS